MITVQTNEAGDTVFRSVVTDRTNVRSRDNIAAYRTKVVEKWDTVYIEKRDSVLVKNTNVKGRDSPVVMALRWICAIILGLIALVVVLRIRT